MEIAKARGWKWRSTGIVWHMRAKGRSEKEIIQELITIVIEILSSPSEPES